MVEANTQDLSNLEAAANFAKKQTGVVVVTMSWGFQEGSDVLASDEASADITIFAQPTGHPNVTFLASAGDDGDPGVYPAYSPNVVAVGGTTLTTDPTTGAYQGEIAWDSGGGGESIYEPVPSFQTTVASQNQFTNRASPDISFDADPFSGVSVYDSYDLGTAAPWTVVGGTSLSSPSWAALIAIADQGRAADGLTTTLSTAQTLADIYSGTFTSEPGIYNATTQTYSKPAADFIDITQGDNFTDSAGPGYDLVTGRGSPNAPYAINDFVGTFEVLSSTPARGSAIGNPKPSSFTINFSDPILATSVAASDFTVNGKPASSDTINTANDSITFNFTTSPVTAVGAQTMAIAKGAISSTSGVALSTAYSATFAYDTLPQLTVKSTAPANNAVAKLPLTTIVVTFSEQYLTSSISTSNLTLSEGTVTKAVATTDTTSSATATYTISGVTTEGILNFTMASGRDRRARSWTTTPARSPPTPARFIWRLARKPSRRHSLQSPRPDR